MSYGLLTVLLLQFLGFRNISQTPVDYQRIKKSLKEDRWSEIYRERMTAILDAVDRKLSADELLRGLSSKRVAWSHDLILWTMLVAVAYPIFAFIAQWAFGGPLILADVEIALAGDTQAIAAFWLWLGSAAAIFVLGWLKSPLGAPLFVGAMGILVVGDFFRDQFGIPAAVAFATAAVTAAIAVTVTVTSTAVVTVTVTAFASAAAIAVAFAIAPASTTLTASTVTSTVAVAAAVATAVAAAIAYAYAVFLFRVQEKRGCHPGWWLFFTLLLALSMTAIVEAVPLIAITEEGAKGSYIVLFLGVFPLLNAVADFASIGLTRHLLRQGLERLTWVNALKDFALGLGIFALLGCASITYLHLVRPGDSEPLLNLADLFESLDNTPEDNWWLFVMLFTTLIPTLLHAMIGLFTLVLRYPAPLRRKVVALLESGAQGSAIDGRTGSLIYCLMISLSIWVPVWALYSLLTLDHGRSLGWIIAGFRTYAEFFGAI
ncbi:MAG: hypothetical protein AAGG69_12110 [Pseudomonadota bacterium]